MICEECKTVMLFCIGTDRLETNELRDFERFECPGCGYQIPIFDSLLDGIQKRGKIVSSPRMRI